MPDTPLYFLALLPPVGLSGDIREIQRTYSDRFGSSHALKSPPHITVYPPFRPPAAEEASWPGLLALRVAERRPFSVTLDGYGHFGNRVLYLHVRPAAALTELSRLCHGILDPLTGRTEEDRGFTPHLTLANRDLAPRAFREAWAECAGAAFEATFPVRQVDVLLHRDGMWRVYESLPMQDEG